MRNLLSVVAIAALSVGALAQDKVTLSNGDVLTGKITSMADGKVTIKSPLLDDVVVPIGNVKDIVTNESVTLKTKSGDLWQRRIVGIEGGKAGIAVGVTKDLVGTHSAVDLVKVAAAAMGGSGGGGRPDMAQAGGSEIDKADDALEAVRTALKG